MRILEEMIINNKDIRLPIKCFKKGLYGIHLHNTDKHLKWERRAKYDYFKAISYVEGLAWCSLYHLIAKLIIRNIFQMLIPSDAPNTDSLYEETALTTE